MKPTLQALTNRIQRALQLDLFSDFLMSDSLQAEPKTVVVAQSLDAKPHPIAEEPAATPPPHTFVNIANKRRMQIKETLLEYELRRSKRRSIGFLINEGGLRVTAPRWVTIATIENAIREKQGWILSKLRARNERAAHTPQLPAQWIDGASLPYLGRPITLRIKRSDVKSIANPAHFDAASNQLFIQVHEDASEQRIKDCIRCWLQEQAESEFTQRLPEYAERLGVDFLSLSLSNANTRWGSCTSQGRIRLNWRLIHFTPALIDYVVAHELAHRREMNHSARFWAVVESVYPDYDGARRYLRKIGPHHLPAI